ncbi:YpjP family protein [Lentibacillus jeotgali]|uniref:YpjP family protein n=1 Tax=Lentibacillus jeotgali TaxID=558169 RepID=UPI0002628063|nr:YpjP family protein [Lentibacillus jeotgali]
MKLWMRKVAVALVAVVTLGLYIPEFDADVEAEQSKETMDSEKDSHDKSVRDTSDPPTLTAELPDVHTDISELDPIDDLRQKAREQAMIKMGPRITAKVEDEFQSVILPNMEEALHRIMDETGADNLQYYSITEQPSEGFGERIFNIYDERTGHDIARFDVRRENRPMEGYWFNFHYHIKSDGFEDHHEIGEIYWDKNIPPKWMA